jgi:hypothetical protein
MRTSTMFFVVPQSILKGWSSAWHMAGTSYFLNKWVLLLSCKTKCLSCFLSGNSQHPVRRYYSNPRFRNEEAKT